MATVSGSVVASGQTKRSCSWRRKQVWPGCAQADARTRLHMPPGDKGLQHKRQQLSVAGVEARAAARHLARALKRQHQAQRVQRPGQPLVHRAGCGRGKAPGRAAPAASGAAGAATCKHGVSHPHTMHLPACPCAPGVNGSVATAVITAPWRWPGAPTFSTASSLSNLGGRQAGHAWTGAGSGPTAGCGASQVGRRPRQPQAAGSGRGTGCRLRRRQGVGRRPPAALRRAHLRNGSSHTRPMHSLAALKAISGSARSLR